MSKFIDLTGQKFGRLIVIDSEGKDKWGQYKWLCKCDCGNYVKVGGCCLRRGTSRSCGCLSKEKVIERSIIHKMSKSLEYQIWGGMKARCLNKNNKSYQNYSGRGIKVCDRWLNSFENFYKDMGKKPKGKSIDRIDNSKGYYKENCKWATRKEQMRNTRINKMITYKGKTLCVAEWAGKLDMEYMTLYMRLYKLNWSIKRAFNS